jgi:hypothetical protein
MLTWILKREVMRMRSGWNWVSSAAHSWFGSSGVEASDSVAEELVH